MKPHPRIRKTIKWGGAAVTLLLVAAWIGSGWREVGWVSRSGRGVSVGAGVLAFTDSPPSAVGWWTQPERQPREWWFRSFSIGTFKWRYVPLWLPTVGLFVGTTIAWRLDVRARHIARLNLCPKCHYYRAGLAAEAKCPECGSAAP
jgi:hypothetical protein